MLPGYEDLEPEMDAQVDNRLGDSISYSVNGEAPVTVKGFLEFHGDEGGVEGIAPIRKRWTVELRKTWLAGEPKMTDRLTHRKLGNVPYKPSTGTIRGDGNAWYFDIQKA